MAKSVISQIDNYINNLKTTLDNLDKSEIENFVTLLKEAQSNKQNIIVIGNGGSATTASHLACDINKPIDSDYSNRFKIICLNDNPSTILAYGNDISFEDVFVEQLKNFLNKNDLVIAISGSGNSKNLVKAIEYANENGGITLSLTGYDGGILKKISKHSVNTNINDMQISQDIHLSLVHIAMQIIYELD